MVSKMPHLINGGSCTASTRQAACLARFAWMMQATPQRATCRFSLQLGDHKLQDVTTEAIFFKKMVSLAVCDDVALSLTEPIESDGV